MYILDHVYLEDIFFTAGCSTEDNMSEQSGADMMLWLLQICQDFIIYKVLDALFDNDATSLFERMWRLGR